MLKKYNQFINENVKNTCNIISQQVCENYIQDLLNNKINIIPLYRGIKSHDLYQYCSGTNNRISTVNNLHNLIISNDARFNEFQNRSKSTFASDEYTAKKFGTLFLLIPQTNCMFSYIDSPDLYSIIGSPEVIFNVVKDIFNICGLKLNIYDYSIFKNDLQFLDENFNYSDVVNQIDVVDYYSIRKLTDLHACQDSKNFSQLIDNLYNLNNLKNRMKNIKYSEITKVKNNEFWTESPYILINTKSLIYQNLTIPEM